MPRPASALFASALGLLAFAAGLQVVADHRPSLDRPPLSLAASGSSGFKPDAFAPDLQGRDDLPALGSRGVAGAVNWTSAPLETSAALLQLRVNGRLHPPATSLVLRTADGREIAPFENDFSSLDRWKRINFPAPSGPFQIVAHDESPGDWLAFTAPAEVSRAAWLAGKIARSGLIMPLVSLAAALAFAGAWLAREALAASTSSPRWRLVPWCALVAYAVYFSPHLDPIAGPNDSGGYLNSAKALVSGRLGPAPRPLSENETDLTPYLATTFHNHSRETMSPEYPVGLPLIFAAAGRVLTLDRAVPAVLLLHLLLGVFFTRQLARALGLPEGWAWFAAGIIGLSPVYLFQALQPQSDGPALVWCTAAIYWAWSSRGRPWLALPAGLATGLAVLIRPSDTLIIFPVLVALAGAWRQVGLWILGGLPFAVGLAWYDHTLYGNVWLTGYGNQGDGFGWRFVPLALVAYAKWLPQFFSPFVLLAPAGPFLRPLAGRVRLMLAVWLGLFAAFYAAWWCTWDTWYNMRFLLPAAPALVVLALFTLRALTERAGFALFCAGSFARNFAPTALVILLAFACSLAEIRDRTVLYLVENNALHAAGPHWLQEHAPANAVVFAKHATNSLLYYTGLTFIRSDHPSARSPEFLASLARTGRPVYALNYWWEGHGQEGGPGRGQGRPDLPGTWTRVVTLRGDELHVWRWTPP